MALEHGRDLDQSVVGLRQHPGHLGEVFGIAGPGDDVLALGIDQKVARDAGSPGDLIAAEGDSRTGV